MNYKSTLLEPFWEAVLPPVEKKRDAAVQRERERARLIYWCDEDEERERKREVIRGLWMRVNASLLQKRTTEMVRFIQSLPNIIERMVAQIESPAIQDMLARIIQTEEAGVSDVMAWLSEQRLIPRLLELLSPNHPPSTHQIVADLLKGIISVSAPNSSFNPQGGNAMEQQGGLQGSATRDNRLVRELTNKESIEVLVRYLTDNVEVTDRGWKGLETDDGSKHRSDPFVIHPLPSVASTISSLCYVCNVIVEVIRRNNSDLAEPYLFNTLRNRLMSIQSEQMQVEIAPDESPDDSTEDVSRRKMEEVMPELSDKLAIVHLGNLVAALADRFGDLQKLLGEPRSADRVKSALTPNPLTMERFRVIELYAELLHSSNMATLNRAPGTGPEYSSDGALLGGLDGLDKLGQALQAGEEGMDEDTPGDTSMEGQITQARELPVSSGSTDYSLTESDDVPLSDEEDKPGNTPTASKTPASDAAAPPPASPEDAERLRNVMESDDKASPSPKPDAALSTGERLKRQFIRYDVLPTLLDLFFEHSNNNFLHHLVYDILQQILNGQLGKGYNRELVVDLFGRTKLVSRVLDAQRMNDEQVNSTPPKPRLSYMGHISLIAEELVKFFARCPTDLFELIRPTYSQDAWDAFVEGSLRETRARDSQPLAGGKPMTGLGSGLSTNSERSDSDSESDDDIGHAGIGEPLSRTVAKQAVDSFHDANADDDGGMEQFWRPSNARSAGMDSSDDDDDDADWLRPSASTRRDDDDDFGVSQLPNWTPAINAQAFQATNDFDDDDAWGSFTSVGNSGKASENPFGDDAFAPSSSSFQSAEPLTPRDWAEAFDREFETQPAWAEDAEEVTAIVMPSAGDDDVGTPTSSWSFPGDESDDQGEDLPPATAETTQALQAAKEAGISRAKAQAELAAVERHTEALTLHSEREGGMMSPEEKELAELGTADAPLGPGAAPDARLRADGLVERTMPDGTVVRVPEDDIARGIDEAMEHRVDEVEKDEPYK
jgi:SIT4-associating protein SAP185/190